MGVDRPTEHSTTSSAAPYVAQACPPPPSPIPLPNMLVLSTVRPLARQASSLHRVTLIQALRYQSTAAASSYKNIVVESVGANKDVSLITLNRPKALNALNSELFHELNHAMEACDKDEGIGAIVLTGSEKAFAAGADIKEMKDKEFAEVYKTQFLGHWTKMNSIKKPIIGAVSGYALGGGCELAMMCDALLARDQPRRHPRLWCHATTAPPHRQVTSDGDRP